MRQRHILELRDLQGRSDFCWFRSTLDFADSDDILVDIGTNFVVRGDLRFSRLGFLPIVKV